MGACLCPSDDPESPSQPPCRPLCFHPYIKGSQVMMDESCCIASRVATFHDGIVFSNRPVELYEKVTVKILTEDSKWHGGLRVGFTWEDPSLLEPFELPPFACPNLVKQGKCWACVLPDEYGAEGMIVSFWVDSQGYVFCSVNQESEYLLLLEGVSVTRPLWAVMDIYGRTKAVQLLDPSSLTTNTEGPGLLRLNLDEQSESAHRENVGDDCAICFGYKANTMMLPCTHANFCSDCSLKILNTSGRCPLCRQEVKKILHVSLLAERESPELWPGKAKNICPFR
ncbi:E3 ubiquitin-protein ligase NEURL3 [Rhineura floridana]|uniref:E3 ubiquitin-protein ligase NEURL3 n=1 Tax=Rhineura floridana TaxID=261503 RepID=UPI002AC86563|nr:E3 ubiquitin-protein ligase NEURL3 [Rhineura floridana]